MMVVDTDVLIDVLRNFAPALEWFATLSEPPAVVSLSVMELIQGCRSHQELDKVTSLIAPLPVWYPSQEEMRSALEVFREYHLRYRLGIVDAIIGVCVVYRGGVLYTFNTRHYTAIPGLMTASPYERA